MKNEITRALVAKKKLFFFAALVLAAGLNAQTVSTSTVHFRTCQDKIYAEQVETANCGSYTWEKNGQTYTETGEYEYREENAAGCYDVYTLNLTVNDKRTSESKSAEICNGSYIYGDQIFTEPGTYTIVTTNDNGCDHTVTLTLTEGTCVPDHVIAHPVTVDENGRQIYFADANIIWRYFLSEDELTERYDFSFLEHPYDISYNAHLPFGASGYNFNDGHHCPGNKNQVHTTPLYGSEENEKYDWGIYNNEALGGTEQMKWRTPKSSEFEYIINSRTIQDDKEGWAFAKVNNIPGIVILPDDWTQTYPSNRGTSSRNDIESNSYGEDTDHKWTDMAAQGVIFLPMDGYNKAGYPKESDWYDKNEQGYYWTADYNESNNGASYLTFRRYQGSAIELPKATQNDASPEIPYCCVRLVMDVPAQQ